MYESAFPAGFSKIFGLERVIQLSALLAGIVLPDILRNATVKVVNPTRLLLMNILVHEDKSSGFHDDNGHVCYPLCHL